MNNVHITAKYVVLKEGKENMDPYRCIVDTGCPRTVAGRIWMDAFAETTREGEEIKRRENESFVFGPSDVYHSKENYKVVV